MKHVVKTVTAFALMLNVTAVYSQDLMAGTYEGSAAYTVLPGNYRVESKLRVIVDGGDVGVTVKAPRCLGSVEGRLARNRKGELFLVSSSYSDDGCAIAIERHGKFAFSMKEGPECAYNHGAACNFDGFVERVR